MLIEQHLSHVTMSTSYDPRYLKGIELFNAREFFEAHEAWEELWLELPTPDRRFYQGLIQAAAAFLKVETNSHRGALSLYESARRYLEPFQPSFQGLDVTAFITAFDRCFQPLIAQPPDTPIAVPPELIPAIRLEERFA